MESSWTGQGKEIPKSSLALFIIWRYNNKSVTRRVLLPLTMLAPWSQTSSVGYKICSLWHFIIEALMDWQTWILGGPGIECYILNVYIPPKFIHWNLIPSVMIFLGGTFGTWLSHEGGALMNRINFFTKEIPERSFAPSAMWGLIEKTAFYEQESRPSLDTESVLFISHSVY